MALGLDSNNSQKTMAIHGTTSSHGCFPVAATRPSLSRSSLTVASCFSLRGTQGGLAGLWGPLSVAKLITKEGGYQRMVQIDLVHKGKTILSVYSKWWSKLYSPDPAEDVCGEEPAIPARNCITIFISFSGFVSFHTRCFLFTLFLCLFLLCTLPFGKPYLYERMPPTLSRWSSGYLFLVDGVDPVSTLYPVFT